MSIPKPIAALLRRTLTALAPAYRRLPETWRASLRSLVIRLPGKTAHGIFQKYATTLPDDFYERFTPAAPPTDQSEAEWEAVLAIAASRPSRPPALDVIIPVYRGFDETLACLYSVIKSENEIGLEIVVVDDAGPDPILAERLKRLAARGAITLLTNDTNRGFVASVNRGMKLHPDRDVVLLNSDTEVYGDWLDRLRATALSGNRAATVTPLTTNGQICSYPFPMRDNYMELGPHERIDTVARHLNVGLSIDVPTAVGFCMYIRREAIDQVGYFDEEAFGKGYGEENDFCLRATTAGWRHMLAGNVFVRHVGQTSFGESRQAAVDRAMSILRERYPDYERRVQEHVIADPARAIRRNIDIGRLLGDQTHKPSVLFVSHNRGGGVERHLRDLEALLDADGVACLTLRPDPRVRGHVTLGSRGVPITPNLTFSIKSETADLGATLSKFNIRLIHVHHVVDFPAGILAQVPKLSAMLSVPYDVTLHDYLCICPRINLINETCHYCGEPNVSQCETCVKRNGAEVEVSSVADWRSVQEVFLAAARRRYVPDDDVATRLNRYFPYLEFLVRPHAETLTAEPTPLAAAARQVGPEEPLRVAIIGALVHHKGFEIVRRCAMDAATRDLPLTFVIIGYTADDARLAGFKNIEITGKYQEDQLANIVAERHCDLAWFSSVWPETYSYTLSQAFALGLFPLSFDFGAIARRIRACGWGAVIPTSDLDRPEAINDRLLRQTITARPETVVAEITRHRYPNFLADYYDINFS